MGILRRLREWREDKDGTLIGPDIDADSVNTDKATINHGVVRGRNGERLDASKFDGSDADARLDNAISAASQGDQILLENDTYTDDRTISTRVTLHGTNGSFAGGTIQGTWTISGGGTKIRDIYIDDTSGGQLVIDAIRVIVEGCTIGGATANGIQVNVNGAILTALYRGSITFDSGTTNGVVDASSNITITDNGSNTVGDIA